MPGCLFPLPKTARQTVPNDPEPMTSSRVIRLRDISHLSTSAFIVSMSSPSSTFVGLKHRNAANYLKIKPPSALVASKMAFGMPITANFTLILLKWDLSERLH